MNKDDKIYVCDGCLRAYLEEDLATTFDGFAYCKRCGVTDTLAPVTNYIDTLEMYKGDGSDPYPEALELAEAYHVELLLNGLTEKAVELRTQLDRLVIILQEW